MRRRRKISRRRKEGRRLRKEKKERKMAMASLTQHEAAWRRDGVAGRGKHQLAICDPTY